MVGTVQCYLMSKENMVRGLCGQGGLHNKPVVKDLGFEEPAEELVVNVSIKRVTVLEENSSVLERIWVLEPKLSRFKFGLSLINNMTLRSPSFQFLHP